MAIPRLLTCPSGPTPLGKRLWAWVAVLVLFLSWGPSDSQAVDALVLERDVPIRRTPQKTGKVIQTARSGETYEVPGRRPGRSQPVYILDENGEVWVKIRVSDEESGFVPTDLVAVAREEYRPPRGNSLLIVNLRPTGDGGVSRDLWLIQEDWQKTRRLATIEGRPLWVSHGEWFICQVDSGRPIKDQSVDRNVERIEKFSADGRVHNILAAGSYPILNEGRGEIYFYRDVDDHGAAVPPGLFAVNVEGGGLRPVSMLPERYKFWKEDGDFFVQAPPPILHAARNRILFYAFEPLGSRVRFTVSPEGQFLELRRD
jgi:hypothetical protein